MTQYNNVNVKLSDSQLNKFKSATKKDGTNLSHKPLPTNRQVV